MSLQPTARHAAPRRRRAVLPAVLLTAAGGAFTGLAVLPAADVAAPRVLAASALAPAPVPLPEPAAGDVAPANVALGKALAQGLAVANSPRPSPPAPPRAARSRQAPDAAVDQEEPDGRQFVRPGLGRRTSSYGRRWGRLHAGVDLAAGTGSPIRAVGDAVVKSARRESGYGLCVRLRHADGTETVYAHMSRLLVNAGERVEAGERIGLEGNTGRSTGPHLHFEVRINGTPINPAVWLRRRGVSV